MRCLPLLTLLAAAAVAHAQDPAPDPCVDFYGYVNRQWLAATELAPDRARIGSFDQLRIANAQLLHAALAEMAASSDAAATPGQRNVVADYDAGMDLRAIEDRGLTSLQPLLARIDALTAADQLPALLALLAQARIGAPFAVDVSPDSRDKKRHTLMLRQAGLGLPDRDDYFGDDDHARRVRGAYRVYVQRLLELSNAADADAAPAAADTVLQLETRLAQVSSTRVQLRDPKAGDNVFDARALARAAPGFDWAAWLAAYGAPEAQRFVVGQPVFLRGVAHEAGTAAPAVWRAYLRVRLLDAYASRLPPPFERASFDFHGAAVRGLGTPLPRSERVIGAIASGPAAEGLGEIYVARAFSREAQARALQLVDDIKAAFGARIERLDWMSAPTKARAQAKLAALVPKIGVPPEWRSYAGLVMRRDDYAGNALRAAQWLTKERLADLDRPVDRARWNTSPHVVNAFAGGLNDIVFPAGILQPPFFDAGADDAVNYGAIGSVIGHEIIHHFDDRGRQFDADGNLADWWSPADAVAYRDRVDRVVALYGSWEPVPGVRINGRQTLGENVSDLSGVQIAFDALLAALKRDGHDLNAVAAADGTTPAQRFFAAYAALWRSKQRVEAMVTQLRSDNHAPGPYRVLGPLSNMPAFAAAYGCKPGAPMAAAAPIVVW